MHLDLYLAPAGVRAEVETILGQVETVVLGKRRQLELALACLLAGGHLLIEDRPGTGKTVLAHALASAMGLEFLRVQFTSDLLPSDILGATVYDRNSGGFEFRPGPVFTQILLADEINRATPKSQSALLEVMEERQVSAEGRTFPLPDPFFVIATQNPSEHLGTHALPDAQLDRFLMRIDMGYPGREAELAVLAAPDRRSVLKEMTSAFDAGRLKRLRATVETVHVSSALFDYLYCILDFTRNCEHFSHGLSTRAGLALLRAARAWALVQGEDKVLPSHVQAVLPSVVAHRLAGVRTTMPVDRIGPFIIEAVAVP